MFFIQIRFPHFLHPHHIIPTVCNTVWDNSIHIFRSVNGYNILDGIYAHRRHRIQRWMHFIRCRDPYLAIARESIHGYPKNTHAQCVAPMSSMHSCNNAFVCPASPPEPPGTRVCLLGCYLLQSSISTHVARGGKERRKHPQSSNNS